jgi:hypothetical protein
MKTKEKILEAARQLEEVAHTLAETGKPTEATAAMGMSLALVWAAGSAGAEARSFDAMLQAWRKTDKARAN